MRKHKPKSIYLLIVVLAVALVLFTSCGNNSIDNDQRASSETSSEQVDNTVLATIFFASDYQEENGFPKPEETLEAVLESAEDDGKDIDEMIICGDYTNDRVLHDYQLSPEESISEIENIAADNGISTESTTFVQGNHDKLTSSISESGLHEFDNYLVYVVNTENDFPWKQGKTSGCLDKVKDTSEKMEKCFDELIQNGEKRPVIIAGHVPLHYSARTSSLHSTGDNLYSSIVFDVVNEAAKSLDIVYLFGHNHTKGWDCYLGESCIYKTEGESIILPKFTSSDVTTDSYIEETLNFTYMNAGYTGHCMNCSTDENDAGIADQYEAADNTLTGTVCEIYEDRLVFSRYSADGTHQICSEGFANPYYDDSDLIPKRFYSDVINGPATVERKAANK